MASRTAIKRLTVEYKRLQTQPPPYIVAKPLESNLFEWHYILTGPPDSPYEGGEYHGRIVFPNTYPYAPPAIRMITPSGRFATDTRLCLSMSDFHPDSWNPMWSVPTILTGLLSFMLEDTQTTGSIVTTAAQKRQYARASYAWNRRRESNPRFVQHFPQRCTPEHRAEWFAAHPTIFGSAPAPAAAAAATAPSPADVLASTSAVPAPATTEPATEADADADAGAATATTAAEPAAQDAEAGASAADADAVLRRRVARGVSPERAAAIAATPAAAASEAAPARARSPDRPAGSVAATAHGAAAVPSGSGAAAAAAASRMRVLRFVAVGVLLYLTVAKVLSRL